MPAYYGETAASCTLDQCLMRTAEMIGWKEKFPCRDMGNGKVRSVGIAMAMQGSGISGVDVGSASIKLNEDGYYTLTIGAADMGTGCDTILAQMAAECLDCSTDQITVYGADTDASPYDSGSYASSTTYVTGKAVERACGKLLEKMEDKAAELLRARYAADVSGAELEFDGTRFLDPATGESVTLTDLGTASMCGSQEALQVTETHSSPVSPPPFMAGAVEIELDKETGHVEILDYAAVVDCGTVINPNLARVQTEGGIVQGIGMALYENVQYDKKGHMMNNSFMQYKIPTRLDMGRLRVEFESSYEPTGPFGAKSIGEIVINTPSPAIAHAIANATGLWFKELPITSEKIAMGRLKKDVCIWRLETAAGLEKTSFFIRSGRSPCTYICWTGWRLWQKGIRIWRSWWCPSMRSFCRRRQEKAPGQSAIPLWKRSEGPFLPAPAVCILYTAPRAGREYPTASGPGSWRECRNPARSLECAGRRPGESRTPMCFLWPTSRGFRKGPWRLFWNS